MHPKLIIFFAFFAFLIILLLNTLFSVNAGENALLLRLGKIVIDDQKKAEILTPGLHVKMPFITSAYILDMRLQNLDAESPRILTKEQKYLYVDYYAKWKIINAPLYYTRTGARLGNTQSLLKQTINDGIRSEFGKRLLQDVISDDRLKIMTSLQKSVNKNTAELGIEVTDVRIKSIDLLPQVLQSVYQRMSTKREQVATEYRADGEAQSERIRSTADAQAEKMIGDANQSAAFTRAKGDTEAANIYQQAYQQDFKFYSFYRSLQVYQASLSRNTILILKPDNTFLKYFNNNQLINLPSK